MKRLTSKIYSKNQIESVKSKIMLLGVDCKLDEINLLNFRLFSSIIIFFVLLYFLDFGYFIAPVVIIIYYTLFFNFYFNNKIDGFNSGDAIIAGVETRTSSPIRIVRGENGMSNIDGIYPIGEGAGYSGGITTSAMDGIKISELIAKVYKN